MNYDQYLNLTLFQQVAYDNTEPKVPFERIMPSPNCWGFYWPLICINEVNKFHNLFFHDNYQTHAGLNVGKFPAI